MRRLLKGRPWFLPPPLCEEDVAAFESAQGVRLPEDYRKYLLTIAGVPPAYSKGYGLHECLGENAKYGDFLRTPFPHAQHWNEMECADYHDSKQVAGSLLLTHEGCCIYFRLVVTGPMRGTVWEDSRGADCGVFPLENSAGMPMTFTEWIGQLDGTHLR